MGEVLDRFVEHQDGEIGQERSAHRHSLALTTRESTAVSPTLVSKPLGRPWSQSASPTRVSTSFRAASEGSLSDP